MKYRPQDIVALGLLGFIFLYLILAVVVGFHGIETEGAGERSKEIVIYIVGVLSGYIGNHIVKDK